MPDFSTQRLRDVATMMRQEKGVWCPELLEQSAERLERLWGTLMGLVQHDNACAVTGRDCGDRRPKPCACTLEVECMIAAGGRGE